MIAVEAVVWLTLCVYFEAQGESQAGQVAVVHTILNRAAQRQQSVIEVIQAPNQFSWLHDNIPDAITDFAAFSRCAKSVAIALDDRLQGQTMRGVNHYYNPKKVDPAPYWAGSMKVVAEIGNHLFLKG